VIALHDGRHELIPAWMTHPDYGKISVVSIPSFSDKVKSKTRRDNGETKRASTSDHMEAYTISHLNSI